jgi:hypothetical protein
LKHAQSWSGPTLGVAFLAHVGEHEIIERDRLHSPCRVEDGSVSANEEIGLLVGVALLDNLLACRKTVRVPPGSRESMVRCQQCAHVSGQLDLRVDQDDEVITDPFEIRHEMRREDHRDAVLSDDFHEALEKLTPGKGVEGGHRFIEEEEFRTFGDCQCEGNLGALTARHPSGLLAWVEAELIDPALRQFTVPGRI